jgi:hypothetical protein
MFREISASKCYQKRIGLYNIIAKAVFKYGSDVWTACWNNGTQRLNAVGKKVFEYFGIDCRDEFASECT